MNPRLETILVSDDKKDNSVSRRKFFGLLGGAAAAIGSKEALATEWEEPVGIATIPEDSKFNYLSLRGVYRQITGGDGFDFWDDVVWLFLFDHCA